MSTDAKRSAWIIRVGRAHVRLAACVLLGLVVMLVVPAAPITRMLIGWDVGALAYLAAAAVVMVRCGSTAQMRRNAAAQDEGAFAILILTTVAALASLGAIFTELAVIARDNPRYGQYAALAITTVALSWAFIHTIFALHYAHEFYGAGERKNGLRFPEDNHPDYWDFIYFSFVIGMTFQVSDVAVTHKSVRRTVVAHGALSFLFVTAILAMTVNIAAHVIQK
jgi:uncharacterized membrane protein